jgi:FkbM family methyltransferase
MNKFKRKIKRKINKNLPNYLLLLNCMQKYGLRNGRKLYLHFKHRKFDNIALPILKYPVSIRNIWEDVLLFKQIFLEDSYKYEFLGRPQVIIDAGANIGLFAILTANRFPQAKIICIEPDKENFELLKQNTALYNNIFCENCGLWSKNTNLKITNENGEKWSFVVNEDENGNIQAITVDFLMEKYDISEIDILKMDIETSEKKVFSENYENFMTKTKMLIVELHDRIENGCAKTFLNAVSAVYEQYRYSTLGDNTTIIENIIKK